MEVNARANMVDVFVERTFDEPITEDDLQACDANRCLELYAATWRESYLAPDGRRMLCRFTAPDAESVRMALRHSRIGFDAVWSGTVYEPRHDVMPNVVIEHRFARPIAENRVRAMVDSLARYDTPDVTLVRACVSTQRERMICFYRTHDARSDFFWKDRGSTGATWACKDVASCRLRIPDQPWTQISKSCARISECASATSHR
jgi:hypothetical protein